MSDTMEIRELFNSDGVLVRASMVYDEDGNSTPEYEDPADRVDYERRRDNGDFVFVGLKVEVWVRDVMLGDDDLWGIEHGQVAEDVTADAWELTPARYPAPNTVVMGSPLSGVVCDALACAEANLVKLGAPVEVLAPALRWADPNAEQQP